MIPTLDEASVIEGTLRRLREAGHCEEIVVIDGGSRDGTVELARPWATLVRSSTPGRAQQMNVGASLASGDALLFLHADTLVPVGFARELADALADPHVVGGRFDVELDGTGLAFRVIERAISLRSRWTRLSTGDQGMFVRRQVFEKLGGFPEEPLLEDLILSAAMKREGRIACLRSRVRTSARRWQERGVARTVALMWWIRALFFVGVPPRELSKLYREGRFLPRFSPAAREKPGP